MIRVKDSRFAAKPDFLETLIAGNPIKAVLDTKTGQPNGNYLTGPVRLSWTKQLFEARKDDGGSDKYGCAILFPLGVDLTALAQAVQQTAAVTFPANMGPQGFNWAGLKTPFHDQAEKMSQYSGYMGGAIFFNTSSKFKPVIVDARMNPIVEESRVYPGVWALAAVNPYGFNNKTKGVGLGLQSLMIIADDDNVGKGAAANPSQDFAGINIAADTNVAAAFGQVPGVGMPLPGQQSEQDVMRSMGLPV